MLETLLSLDCVDKVIINTDARPQLAKVGVTDTDQVLIRDRKPTLCGNDVSMNLVLADDLDNVKSRIYLMTHTTNPLLSLETIGAAIAAFEASDCDSLFTVNRHQTRFYRADGTPLNHDPNNLIPTQDLEPWYEENSNLYIFTHESFGKTNARIGCHPLMYPTPRLESLDIDTWDDWHLAEAAAVALQKSKGEPL